MKGVYQREANEYAYAIQGSVDASELMDDMAYMNSWVLHKLPPPPTLPPPANSKQTNDSLPPKEQKEEAKEEEEAPPTTTPQKPLPENILFVSRVPSLEPPIKHWKATQNYKEKEPKTAPTFELMHPPPILKHEDLEYFDVKKWTPIKKEHIESGNLNRHLRETISMEEKEAMAEVMNYSVARLPFAMYPADRGPSKIVGTYAYGPHAHGPFFCVECTVHTYMYRACLRRKYDRQRLPPHPPTLGN